MTTFRYAGRAARLLRAARARIRPHHSGPPENAIGAIVEAIERTTARRRRRRAATAIGLAAAMVGGTALVAVAPWRSGGPASLGGPGAVSTSRAGLVARPDGRATVEGADGRVMPLPPGHAWRSGERLQADALPLALAAEDGTTVELEPQSDLKLLRADAEQWLRLGGGAVAVHVAKLKEGQRFVILTPDAQVEVRGTRFHVALASPSADCGHGTLTRVVVDEGVVVVRSAEGEVRVAAGQRWPAACATPHVLPVPASLGHPVVTKRSPRVLPVAPASTLATENDLFGAALRAEHSGDRAEATHLLDALLTRFPHSPLRESAERARTRVTATASPSP